MMNVLNKDDTCKLIVENFNADEIYSLIEDLCEDDDVMDKVYQKFEDIIADSGIWREWR